MREDAKDIIDKCLEEIKETSVPWNDKLFKVDEDSPKLQLEEAETFHTFVMKGMFLVKELVQTKKP